jgi:hypothetical protein
MLRSLTEPIHELLHRLRCLLSPAYADEAALVRDEATQEFLRECRTNDYAHLLRERGYDIPVGTRLFGVEVTR